MEVTSVISYIVERLRRHCRCLIYIRQSYAGGRAAADSIMSCYSCPRSIGKITAFRLVRIQCCGYREASSVYLIYMRQRCRGRRAMPDSTMCWHDSTRFICKMICLRLLHGYHHLVLFIWIDEVQLPLGLFFGCCTGFPLTKKKTKCVILCMRIDDILIQYILWTINCNTKYR